MTLRRQLVLVIALVLLISLVGTFLTIRKVAITPGALQLAELVSGQFHLFDKLRQDQNLDTFIGEDDINSIFSFSKSPEAQNLAPIMFNQAFKNSLLERMGENTRIKFSPQGSMLWISQPKYEPYWIGVHFPDYTRKSIKWVALSLIGSFLLALLVGGFYARHVTRPLVRLSQMTEKLGQRDKPVLMDLSGPFELQTLQKMMHKAALDSFELSADRKLMMVAISHDLRTPMARIRVATEMLQEHDLRDGIIDDLKEMDGILSGFMTLMKEGEGEQYYQLDVAQTLQTLCERQQRIAKPISCQLTGKPLMIYAQPLSIERILENLVANAWKHGKPPVEITTSLDAEWIEICIIDHGDGICEKDRERILKPFQQGEQARTQGGAGLGLAIVKRFVDLQNGTFELKQNVQGGLCACVRFKRLLD